MVEARPGDESATWWYSLLANGKSTDLDLEGWFDISLNPSGLVLAFGLWHNAPHQYAYVWAGGKKVSLGSSRQRPLLQLAARDQRCWRDRRQRLRRQHGQTGRALDTQQRLSHEQAWASGFSTARTLRSAAGPCTATDPLDRIWIEARTVGFGSPRRIQEGRSECRQDRPA